MTGSTKALATAISAAVASLALAAAAATAAPDSHPISARIPLATPSLISAPPALRGRMRWFHWHPTARSLQARRFGSTVVVGLESMRDLASLRRRYRFERVLAIPALRAAEVGVDAAELHQLLTAAPRDPRIRYVSPAGRARHLLSMPNDPLVKTIDPSTGLPYEWQFASSHVDRAFDMTQGDRGIVVGVIDTGADEVPDLAGKIDALWNVAPDLTITKVPVSAGNDDVGHGTAVVSLIAANVGDGFGMAGFGGAAHVIVVHAGTVTDMPDDRVAVALTLLDSLGVRIVNMSFGAQFPSEPHLVDAIHKAAADGMLLVASSGNDYSNRVSWPAANLQPSGGGRSYGIAVGATNMDGMPADFSNNGGHLSLVAPGNYGGRCSGVLVALPTNNLFEDHPCNYEEWPGEGGAMYGYINGTSFAAPEVAGIAALIWAARPQLKNYQVADIIKQSARRTGGWTPTMGCGQLDAGAALELATSRSADEWANPTPAAAVPCSADGTEPAAWPSELNQTITFGSLADRTVGDADFPVAATASSGLPVSFKASGSCTITVAVVRITGAGSCTITASQGGDADYKPALDVLQTFNIAPAAIATALPASGKWGASVNLTYRIQGSQNVATGITVLKNRTAVAHLARGFSKIESGRVYTLAWKAPSEKTKDTFNFCVTLRYPAHTKSAPSCARIRLR